MVLTTNRIELADMSSTNTLDSCEDENHYWKIALYFNKNSKELSLNKLISIKLHELETALLKWTFL